MGDDRRHLQVKLEQLLGTEGFFTGRAARKVYALDSSHLESGLPWAVALPQTSGQMARVVQLCSAAGVPVVCRGSGTGLSGGAVPGEGALVLGTARLNTLSKVSVIDRTVLAQAGVLNQQVSTMAASDNLHFAPDPSSQAIASIGGNIAENAGGPHCLRYGVTLQHLRRMQWIDAQGNTFTTGLGLPAERGLDLVSLLCGSEGTLGIVTEADLKLVENPAAVNTLLAFFPDLHDATCSVVSLLTAGLQPVAVEMVDQAMLVAVEEAFAFGFPTDVAGAMIAEFTGSEEEVAEDVSRALKILTEGGAREVRQATDEAERLELWKCRKKAFGAVGRLAPRYVTMDVVVPLGSLPDLVNRIQEIKARHGVDVATAFHAGDGNLHPGIHYDDRIDGQTEKAHRAADEIIKAALEMHGTATGEHGVGLEKQHVMAWLWDTETARLNREIKNVFDPDGVLNPGKIFPPEDTEFLPLKPIPAELSFRWDSMSVTAPAKTDLAEIQDAALQRGLSLPVGVFNNAEAGSLGLGAARSVGDLIAQLVPGPAVLPRGTARDFLLEIWARTGDGRLFHTGAPVFKNVAGYGLGPALCGSGKDFVEPLAATFQLKPICENILALKFSHDAGAAELELVLDLLPTDDISSPTVVFDEGSLVVLVGGRHRSWSLDSLAASLIENLRIFSLQDRQIISPEALGSLLQSDFFPDWARSSENWMMLSRSPGSGGTETVPVASRLIWQAVPGIWWSPDRVADVSGWHTDQLLKKGTFQPAPAAADGVPVSLLAAIKNLFDPHGSNPALPGFENEK